MEVVYLIAIQQQCHCARQNQMNTKQRQLQEQLNRTLSGSTPATLVMLRGNHESYESYLQSQLHNLLRICHLPGTLRLDVSSFTLR